MKRKILKLIVVSVLALGLVACGSASEVTDNDNKQNAEKTEQEEVTIRVGYFNTAQYQTQLAIAKEKGFFDEVFSDDNVNIEYYPFAGAGPAINEAFLAGELDVAHGIGDQPAISGIANGNNSVILSRIVKNTRGTGIVVKYDSDIKTVADLKGKTIAVLIGGAGQKCLDLILNDAGFSEKDVQLVNLSKHDEIIAALNSGEIDAAVSSSLAYTQEEDEAEHVTRQIIDFTTHPNYAYIEFQQEFINKYPDIVEKFLAALNKANDWYYENVDEGNKIVAEFLDLELDDVEKGNGSVDIGMGLEEEDIENFSTTYQFLKDNDLLPEEIEDLSAIYDDTYINKALNN